MKEFEARLSKRLSEITPRKINNGGKGEASVLMSLFNQGSEPAFLLTKRSETVASYKRHISFPGGMSESGDGSLVETALREANEEIGLEAEQVRVVGEFNDYLANEGFVIHTVLGFLDDTSRLILQPEEVDYLVKIPLSFFIVNPPRTEILERNGKSVKVYFYDYQGEVVWGLTARMIKHFIDQLV
jgi:8-oxo-dGTP pyrophosphatase MutT (NUDIX family)